MPLKVHAKVKIKIAGTIALKPSVRLSINTRAEMTLRGIYKRKMTIISKNQNKNQKNKIIKILPIRMM